VIASSGEPIAAVGLDGRIDHLNAPRPSNDSERLLFRQLYETLVRADCAGRVVPGLAQSWRLDSDGRTWIVTLRNDARFSDGTAVTSADVRASWLHDRGGDDLHRNVRRLVETVVAIDDVTLAIRTRNRRVDMPLALTHTDLSVAKIADDSQWPLGTRAARVVQERPTRPGIASTSILLARDNLPAIRFLIARGDPRDLLDDGVDLLLTRDAAALDYAATLPHVESVPLAWQRTYVLLTPHRSRAAALPGDARQRLADDAVRGEARGAQEPFWWQTSADCAASVGAPSRPQPAPLPRIAYDADDPVARDLAERFVGLARAAGADAQAVLAVERARGLTGAPLAAALRRGADAGYIVSLDKRPEDPCRELEALMETAPWLDTNTVLPLVETRLRAVVRRGMAGVRADWDGGLLITAPKSR
jgi:hypothetical protein